MRKRPSIQGSTGFTLIELITVTAIIALLASLLETALAHAKQASRRIACTSQIRQLTLAWVLYADDNGGRVVPNRTEGNPPQTQSTADSWVVGSVKISATVSARGVNAGALYPYVRVKTVYHCPSDASTNRSYSMNCGLDWFLDTEHILKEPLPSNYMITTLVQIAKPTETFVMIDENEGSIDNGHFGINWVPDAPGGEPPATWLNLPSTRHDSPGTVISFADGHATLMRWRAPKVWHDYDQDASGENDLADLRRIQSIVIPQ